MMSFLALNLQVAEASVAMHEMPIATAAKEIAIRQATAFPFLKDVCIGRTRPSCRGLDERLRQRGEQFDEAANAFAEDTLPTNEELMARGGSWSGINVLLWTKYFRARARLLEAIRNPRRVKDSLAKAVERLDGTQSGFYSAEVSRFRVLVETMYKLVSDPSSLSAESAQKEYMFAVSSPWCM